MRNEVKKGRPNKKPIRLIMTIGGFGGPNYELRLRDDGTFQYSSCGSEETVTPTAEAWGRFWVVLNRIGVWGWGPKYDDPEILDGTQWRLTLSDGARSVRCYGSNNYPPRFQEFLQAVRALTGQSYN